MPSELHETAIGAFNYVFDSCRGLVDGKFPPDSSGGIMFAHPSHIATHIVTSRSADQVAPQILKERLSLLEKGPYTTQNSAPSRHFVDQLGVWNAFEADRDKHHDAPLSFEILALPRSKDLNDLYNQQRGGHGVTAAPTTTSPELPLGKSVLASKTATPSGAPKVRCLFQVILLLSFTDLGNLGPPGPDAFAASKNFILLECKPDELAAGERVRENAQRLIDSVVAKNICSRIRIQSDQTTHCRLDETNHPTTNYGTKYDAGSMDVPDCKHSDCHGTIR
ncbi:hypothetical protein PENFLA_c040G09042 [Penicillium flavigenum]|uniref:Uncharacterized protein n=1 Tax=Penicillium flavigenum TaxID=254877 RepID=A0A1V6SJN5_9EURO|nr:hypothetical protein PENFLA_c040G09042 [Penicillium flavigenum]